MFVRALIAPVLVAAGMAVVVGSWRFVMLGRMPDAIYIVSAIFVGVLTVCTLLFGLMPNTVARLRTFIAEREEV